MNNDLTYKTKNIIAVVATFIFGIIAYQFAIGKTMSLKEENDRFQTRMEKAKDAPTLLRQYKANLKSINSQLGYVGTNDQLSQDKILDLIENFSKSNNTYLKEYSKTILNTDNVYNLETNVIEIEGDYPDIVRLIYEIEFLQNVSKVTATYFIKQKNISTKKTTLTATIYLQNINIK